MHLFDSPFSFFLNFPWLASKSFSSISELNPARLQNVLWNPLSLPTLTNKTYNSIWYAKEEAQSSPFCWASGNFLGGFLSVCSTIAQWCPTLGVCGAEMGIWQQGWLLAGLFGKITLAFSFPAESDKDEAAEEDGRLGTTVVPRQVTSALSSLSVNYGSASDSEPEGVWKQLLPFSSPLLPCVTLQRQDCKQACGFFCCPFLSSMSWVKRGGIKCLWLSCVSSNFPSLFSPSWGKIRNLFSVLLQIMFEWCQEKAVIVTPWTNFHILKGFFHRMLLGVAIGLDLSVTWILCFSECMHQWMVRDCCCCCCLFLQIFTKMYLPWVAYPKLESI